MDNCLRNSSFSAVAASAVADRVTVSLLDSDKELLFPCACVAEAAIKHNPVANCQMPIANVKRLSPRLFNWQLQIDNWKFFLIWSPSPCANRVF
jgi:hypothetical protein